MTTSTVNTVVFDIGGVLVDWKPHRVWLPELGSHAAVDAFLERIDFYALNLRADAGESFMDLATEIDDPDDARRLTEYVTRYPCTIEDAITGTWAILDRLKDRGVPLHAITNWSAETWPRGLTVQPRLGEVFGTTVISGVEKMLKPDPAIYALLCERAGVAAQDCVFIDDRADNIEAARAFGMDGIHFTDPEALERALIERGLL